MITAWVCCLLGLWALGCCLVLVVCAMPGRVSILYDPSDSTPDSGRPGFSSGPALDALANVLGIERIRGQRRRWTLWLYRTPDESDDSLRTRTREAMAKATGANVDWWGR